MKLSAEDEKKVLIFDKHVEYISNQGNDKNDYEYCMTEFLRMSGIYWGVTALDIMNKLDKIDKTSILDFIRKCQCPLTGGISACEGHDPHILYTLSAVQVFNSIHLIPNINCYESFSSPDFVCL